MTFMKKDLHPKGLTCILEIRNQDTEFVVVQDLDKQPNYGWKPVTRKTRKDGFKIVEQQILS